MRELNNEIEKIIKDEVLKLNRPDLYREPLIAYSSASDPGYENLKEIIGEWHKTPNELLDNANCVISYFVPFTKEVVMTPSKVEHAAYEWGESYEVINKYFVHINEVVCNYLNGEGYTTYTIPPTHTYNSTDIKCWFSHRSAAKISGLGEFGANRMLITKKGSGGRYCTIITSANFDISENDNKQRCLYFINGSCNLCFKNCPANALKIDGFDKFACQDITIFNKKYASENFNQESADTCGKCISYCPVGYIE